jgi:hypothetical protein
LVATARTVALQALTFYSYNDNIFIMVKIVSAFPGTGKSYFTSHNSVEGRVLDSDSSKYSWLLDADGNKIEPPVRDPDFPKNYMNHIREEMDSAAVILVSSHADVRTALVDEGIDFTLVFPERSIKDEYVERFKKRESPQGFIDLIDKNWDVFLGQLEEQQGCEAVLLGPGQFISDVL